MIEFSLRVKELNLSFREVIGQITEDSYEKIIEVVKELDLFSMCHNDPEFRENLYSLHDKFITALPKPSTSTYLDPLTEKLLRKNAKNSGRPYSDQYKWSRKITKHFLIASLCPPQPSESEMMRRDTQELWRAAIEQLPKGQAGTILLQAYPMFYKGKNAQNNLLTVTGIATLPPDYMLTVVKSLAPYLRPDKFGYEKTFTALAEQKERCLEVLKMAIPLIQHANTKLRSVNDYTASEIIEEISRIKDPEIIEWTSQLTEGGNVLKTIKAIKQMDSSYRSEVLKRIGPVLKNTAICNSEVSAVDIFEGLVKLPIEEVLVVVKKAQTHFAYFWTGRTQERKREYVIKLIKDHHQKKK